MSSNSRWYLDTKVLDTYVQFQSGIQNFLLYTIILKFIY